MKLLSAYQTCEQTRNKLSILDGLAPLLFRLYLAPVLIQAGWNKYHHFEDTVSWFGNGDWGLGLPLPTLMVSLAITAELIGGMLLLIGLATRWVSLPLIATMLVAAFSVHWPNGWLAIADTDSWLANGTLLLNENIMTSGEKLAAAKSILQQHGNYEWLTSSGNLVILNNGIEFAVTYLIMLISLFFTGGGRFTSIDYFLAKRFGFNKS